MTINNTAKKILKALSFDGIEVEASRHLADLKRLDPLKIFYKKIDYKIYNGEFEVPTRIFFPHENTVENGGSNLNKVMLFIHGGGWVTESIDNYERICARLANATEHVVISVDYRLAPENKFPIGLEDCYAAAKAIFTNKFILNVDPENITLIGDSAGGNLAAALSLMARDRGEFLPRRQILIYPAVNNDYSDNSPFASVQENGTDYLLTAGKMRDYIDLYAGSEVDKQNPYFAPILALDLTNQPDTLIITAEFDPLRDEGEEYGKRLKEAGNHVEISRIKDALHGYFALGIKSFYVKESFDYINRFLGYEPPGEV
jgi:acetyl esterase/lipase